jgi:hypothetical protein
MNIICQSLYYQYILDKFHFVKSPKTFRVIITIIWSCPYYMSKYVPRLEGIMHEVLRHPDNLAPQLDKSAPQKDKSAPQKDKSALVFFFFDFTYKTSNSRELNIKVSFHWSKDLNWHFCRKLFTHLVKRYS